MTRVLLLCEGPDDHRALRGILTRLLDFSIERRASKDTQHPPFRHASSGCIVEPLTGPDRNRAARRAREAVEEIEVSRFDRVGLVFDPNGDDDDAWQAWLVEDVLRDLAVDRDEGDLWRVSSQRVPFVPIPWDAGSPFADLGEARNLERLALEIVRRGDPGRAALVEELIGRIRASNEAVTWKTALRLYQALAAPDSDVGVLDRVFGQDKLLEPAFRETLEGSAILRRLRVFVFPATS